MFCIFHRAFLRFTFHICTVAIKNIRNMQIVLANQTADIFHFNDNTIYYCYLFLLLSSHEYYH